MFKRLAPNHPNTATPVTPERGFVVPDYVLKNKNKDVAAYVLSLPEGASDRDRDAAVEAMGPTWSLDSKAEPADVAFAAETAAAAASTKEN